MNLITIKCNQCDNELLILNKQESIKCFKCNNVINLNQVEKKDINFKDFNQLIKSADNFYNIKNYEHAEKLYNEIMSYYPDKLEGYIGMIKILLLKFKFKKDLDIKMYIDTLDKMIENNIKDNKLFYEKRRFRNILKKSFCEQEFEIKFINESFNKILINEVNAFDIYNLINLINILNVKKIDDSMKEDIKGGYLIYDIYNKLIKIEKKYTEGNNSKKFSFNLIYYLIPIVIIILVILKCLFK